MAERARCYIAKMTQAISGQHGHFKMFSVACVLVHGFDMNMGDAQMLLEEYNATLAEPFSQKELEHKLQDAAGKESIRGRGYLLNPSDNPIRVRITPKKPANTPPRIIHRIAARTPRTGKSYSADKIKHPIKHDIPDRESKTPVLGVPSVSCSLAGVSVDLMALAEKFACELSGMVLSFEEVDVPADYWMT